MIIEWGRLVVFRNLWSNVIERSFEVTVKIQHAMNANLVYIIQWILMQLVQSDPSIAVMFMSRMAYIL